MPAEREHWVRLWERWPDREVWAHPDYVALFARSGDKSLCACRVEPAGAILFPLILRPLTEEPWVEPNHPACDLVSPYGYGGPFAWGTLTTAIFWSEFVDWVRQIHAVSLFTRLSLFKDQLASFFGNTTVVGQCIVVSVQQAPDDIFKNYDKSARENVRQAERMRVTVASDPGCSRLEEFLSIYYSTMDRLAADQAYYFPRPFFRNLIDRLPEQVMLFHALYDGRVVSTELLLLTPRHVFAFLGGTVTDALHLRCNQLLRHGINLWAKEHGKQQVILGGGYAGQDSLFRYKKKFAPNGAVDFSVGRCIFDETAYRGLVDKRIEWEAEAGKQWVPKAGFFPVYRG